MLPGPILDNVGALATVSTFHLDFAYEIVKNARYEMQTLYSMEHLQLANEALGRKGCI